MVKVQSNRNAHSSLAGTQMTDILQNHLTISYSVKGASLVAPMVKNLPELQETQVGSLGQEDSPGGGNRVRHMLTTWLRNPTPKQTEDTCSLKNLCANVTALFPKLETTQMSFHRGLDMHTVSKHTAEHDSAKRRTDCWLTQQPG